MELIIGADLVPTPSNNYLFEQGDVDTLFGSELLEKWFEADSRLFNLETPLADNKSPIEKQGPNLIAPKSTIKGILALKPSLITLANNHILDQGVIGLNSTLSALSNCKIPHIGAALSLKKANEAHVLKKDHKNICVYTCAEHEFNTATENSPGANPFDPLETPETVEALAAENDYLVVIYHGGKEHFRYPTPYLQKVCRKLADKGADVVICQHSHTVGSFENYGNSTIVYGQGNFIFDRKDNQHWNTSLLIKLNFTEKLSVSYIPIVKKQNVVRIADKKESSEILEGFHKRSQEIQIEGFVERRYDELAKEYINYYLRSFGWCGKWVTRLDKKVFKGKIVETLYSKKKKIRIENYIKCESHRELILKGLETSRKE